MRPTIVLMCLLAFCLSITPATAQQDLYDNGPINGFVNSWFITFGFVVSDQFTLSANSTVNGISFGAFLFPGDVLETAEVSITSSEFGGTSYFDQAVSFAQVGACFSNGDFNVCKESGTFGNVSLNAGSYWLNLQNAVTNTGDPVLWDQNSGPSLASQSSLGTIPSESFTILGSRNGGTGSTPEPSSLVLFASGIIGVFGVVRNKFSA